MEADPRWYETFFDRDWLTIAAGLHEQERVAEALVPGGRFLLETINLLGLIRNYQPRDWRTLGDGSLLTEDRSYDAITGRSRATWTIVRPDGSRSELHLAMRIYSCPELRRMLAHAGLAADGAWGGTDGSKYGVEGRRLIVRGRKPSMPP